MTASYAPANTDMSIHTKRRMQCQMLAAMVLMPGAAAQATDLKVENVTFAQQQPGPADHVKVKKVNIQYDVSGGIPPYNITLMFSADGGAYKLCTPSCLTGDIAPDTPGPNKTITWDAEKDWDKNYSANMKFKVTADDGVAVVTNAQVGLFNTGVNDMEQTLSGGAADSHYGGFVRNSTHPAWLPNGGASLWISDISGGWEAGSPIGNAVYELTVDFSNFMPITAITGKWAVDNAGAISLNGQAPCVVLSLPGNAPYDSMNSFSIVGPFLSGPNKLTFSVENFAIGGVPFNPAGLRVEFDAITFRQTPPPTP